MVFITHQVAPSKAVAEDQADAGEHAEGREEIEGAAGELAPVVGKALHEGAEHHALEEGREQGAEEEGVVPQEFRTLRLEAELEGDAAEDEGDRA